MKINKEIENNSKSEKLYSDKNFDSWGQLAVRYKKFWIENVNISDFAFKSAVLLHLTLILPVTSVNFITFSLIGVVTYILYISRKHELDILVLSHLAIISSFGYFISILSYSTDVLGIVFAVMSSLFMIYVIFIANAMSAIE